MKTGKIFIWVIMTVCGTGCVEGFDFNTNDEPVALILEGQISDVSANDYFEEFNEWRYFEVKLKQASAVKNSRDKPISNAEVELYSDTNEYWDYTEGPSGTYKLMYPDFKALPGNNYKVIVKLPDGSRIESSLEQMPDQTMRGDIFHQEVTQPQYIVQAKETVIRDVEGIDVQIRIPEQSTEDFRYFKWDFSTTWILRAELIPASDPVGECWVTEKYYLDDYVLLKTKNTSPSKSLFFLQTNGNLNVRFGFSVRIKQISMSENHNQFWLDLENQKKQSELFAPPPYNAFTNLQLIDSDKDVYGYFGVVREQNYAWYLNLSDLSYQPTFSAPCFPVVPGDDIAPSCSNCLDYTAGRFESEITNIQPKWWKP